MLTAVVYHYVRDVELTPYSRMYARGVADFEGQLDYVERHYEPVRLSDVRAWVTGEASLPPQACLLTFDDGLRDHVETVLPVLARRGLSGVFCPPASAVLDRRVLDVQKAQLVLAVEPDAGALVERVFASLEPHAAKRPELAPEELWRAHGAYDRFDDPETALLKRLFQYALPDDLRPTILDGLFRELVTDDEPALADELYLTLDGVRALIDGGMELAGHGVAHDPLGALVPDAQRREIEGTVAFLERCGVDVGAGWTMCYPAGSYDATTLELLRASGCVLGLTCDVGLADVRTPPLELPRLDTNDLPVHADAQPVEWTLAARGDYADAAERSRSNAGTSSPST